MINQHYYCEAWQISQIVWQNQEWLIHHCVVQLLIVLLTVMFCC